jgi:aminobenzoyl-glutamate transport protein
LWTEPDLASEFADLLAWRVAVSSRRGACVARAPRSNPLLDAVERIGNVLPEPSFLFVLGALVVMVLSAVAAGAGWTVEPLGVEAGAPPLVARSLLDADGLYYALSSMVDNFLAFPPLGIVLVAMFGIGLAERAGLVGAALRAILAIVPPGLLTPAMIFLGVQSSLGSDAGYLVLPPVAAALCHRAGRSPLVGIAAVFAGIGGGFNANLLVTSQDPLLAGLSTSAARTIDPTYAVGAPANWWFMIASTLLLTGVGWAVTSLVVEPRLALRDPDDGGPPRAGSDADALAPLTGSERRGLFWATALATLVLAMLIAATFVPGAPLDDALGRMAPVPGSARVGDQFDRWVEVIVPGLFLLFLLPGLAYGWITGSIRRGADVAKLMTEATAGMAPVIVLAFFAAQFIEYFKYSNLDKMLAYSGGAWLSEAQLSPLLLVVAFVLVTATFDVFVVSMSAKYAMFAPVFVPMFMVAGISPELTQCAYRIGDSVANLVTPLNPYLVILLVVMRRYAPRAGVGTLLATMLPYAIVFGVAWIGLLIVWIVLGAPLGPSSPLAYPSS